MKNGIIKKLKKFFGFRREMRRKVEELNEYQQSLIMNQLQVLKIIKLLQDREDVKRRWRKIFDDIETSSLEIEFAKNERKNEKN